MIRVGLVMYNCLQVTVFILCMYSMSAWASLNEKIATERRKADIEEINRDMQSTLTLKNLYIKMNLKEQDIKFCSSEHFIQLCNKEIEKLAQRKQQLINNSSR